LKEKAIEMAKELKPKEINPAIIAEASELSIEEVIRL